MARNLVRRPDGQVINVGAPRGMLIVCATGCCCGRTEKGFAPVLTEVYHAEWERRKLRNVIHLNQGGCLGPCQLANIALILFDGRPIWLHSLNSPELVHAVFDYLEWLTQSATFLPPPEPLAALVFQGFAWGPSPTSPHAASSRRRRRFWDRRREG